MKEVHINGKKRVEIRDVPKPQPIEDWALVKIHVAPMCTEFKQYTLGKQKFPLGHEAAGEVVDVIRGDRVKKGDRVVVMPQYPCGRCNLCLSGDYIHCQNEVAFEKFTGSTSGAGTFSEYILKPAWLLPAIPPDISYEHGSMLCCGLGPTFGAMQKMSIGEDDSVLITGLGPVGLGGVINGVSRGARVIGITKNKYRERLALDLGAYAVLDPEDCNLKEEIMDLTKGVGADASIECAGNTNAQKLVLDSTKRNGKVSFVGESGDLQIHVSEQLLRKGLTLFGIWHYNLNYVPNLFDIVRKSKRLLDKLITHVFPIENIKNAWELQLSGQCGKVVIYPWMNPNEFKAQ